MRAGFFLRAASFAVAAAPVVAAFCTNTQAGLAALARNTMQRPNHGDAPSSCSADTDTSSSFHPENRGDERTTETESSVHVASRRGMIFRSTAAVAATLATGTAGNSHAAMANDNDDQVVESKSAIIAAANTFVRGNDDDDESLLDGIAWNAPKKPLPMERLADAINDGLVEREWFVTGNGLPEYFRDDFAFSDPQVSLMGFEEYCRGVRRLFDRTTARCEVVCCSVTGPNVITVLWRNSGKVNIGAASVDLKPYLVTTTLVTESDDDGGYLIASQSDEFDSDPLGLALYQVPALRSLAGRPAPSVEELKRRCDFRRCKIDA